MNLKNEFIPFRTLFGKYSQKVINYLHQYSERKTGLRFFHENEEIPWIEGKRATTCLRCGLCCFRCEVDGIPGYPDEVKPICEVCMYNIPAIFKNNQWKLSECRLYAKRPRICSQYYGPLSPFVYEKKHHEEITIENPCAEGLMYWRRLLDIYGGNLPKHIKKFFPPLLQKKWLEHQSVYSEF